jgi:tetratricopeptide (TPR) repeat protein
MDTPVLKHVAGLTGLWLAAFTTPVGSQQAADHVALGIAATEAHDLRTALQHFQAALDQDSSNYEANWRAALTLGFLGDTFPKAVKSPERDSLYARAERYARRAVAADPAGADGHFAYAASLGRAALMTGTEERIRRAGIIRSEALRAIALNPRHDGAYHILGRWNAEIMRLSSFGRFFAKNFLGARVFSQASWAKAIHYMERAVALDPGRIQHHLALADIYADRKRTRDAEAQLRLVDSLPEREAMDSNYKRQAASLRNRLVKR